MRGLTRCGKSDNTRDWPRCRTHHEGVVFVLCNIHGLDPAGPRRGGGVNSGDGGGDGAWRVISKLEPRMDANKHESRKRTFPGFIRVHSRSFAVQDLDFRVFKLAGSNCAIWRIRVGGVISCILRKYNMRTPPPFAFPTPLTFFTLSQTCRNVSI